MEANMVTTGVTRQLISRTTRLRALARSVDWYSIAAIVALLLVVALIGLRGDARPAEQQPTIVIATPTLGIAREKVGASGAARLRRATARQESTELDPSLALPTAAIVEPTAVPVEQQPTVEPETVEIMQVEQQPTVEPTTEAHWSGDSFVVTGDRVPTVAPTMVGQPGYNGWICGQSYGDWRDTDPMYTHAECYSK